MSNHEAHTRTTSTGTRLWLSPADARYILYGSAKGKSAEIATVVLHESGQWAADFNPIDGVIGAETLHAIVELIDQLNLELRQEQEAK